MSGKLKKVSRKRARKHEFVWDGRDERGEDARLSVVAGAAATDLRLLDTDLRILLHCGRFNAKKGWCKLSQAGLAKLLDCSRTSINRAISRLVKCKYMLKRSQKDAGDSFCLYLVVLDDTAGTGSLDAPDDNSPDDGGAGGEGGVFTDEHTPQQGGVCTGEHTPDDGGVFTGEHTPPEGGVFTPGHTCVAAGATPVCTPGATPPARRVYKARAHVGHIDHVDLSKSDEPSATDGAVSLLTAVRQASARAEIAKGSAEVARGDRLPFTSETLKEIYALGVDVDEMVTAYREKTRSRYIKNPNAYLLRMARELVAKKLGVTAETLKSISTRDRVARGKAMVLAVGPSQEPTPGLVRSITAGAKGRGIDPQTLLQEWRASVVGRTFDTAAAAGASLQAFYGSRVSSGARQPGRLL